MFRTRFKKEIVAEFLPPARARKLDKVIILCDGMPSIPRKQVLVEFLAGKGYWVFYPRWRGAWESGGQFLERSPHEDILDVVDGCRQKLKSLRSARHFIVRRTRSSLSVEALAAPLPFYVRWTNESPK